jgi:hypothetical protein
MQCQSGHTAAAVGCASSAAGQGRQSKFWCKGYSHRITQVICKAYGARAPSGHPSPVSLYHQLVDHVPFSVHQVAIHVSAVEWMLCRMLDTATYPRLEACAVVLIANLRLDAVAQLKSMNACMDALPIMP